MRDIDIVDWKPPTIGSTARGPVPVTVAKGKFVQFGINSEMVGADGQCSTFSTAIIEMEDGTLRNVALNRVRFTDRDLP